MICVYPADCTDFSTNGNGTLAPLSAEVTETLNGEYELTLVHPIDEAGKWQRLVEGCILRAPVPAAMTPRVNFTAPGDDNRTEVWRVHTDFSGAETRGGTLNLRNGPGREYKILAAYKNTSLVQVIAKTNASWYEVTAPDGKHGYMSTTYRGGNLPYGYKLEHQGRTNKKNQEVRDLMIDEDEAAIVREIFDLLTNHGYGTNRVAQYLNEKGVKTKRGTTLWRGTSIRALIDNPIYIGIYHMQGVQSEPFEHLRIIDDNLFQRCQQTVKGRSTKNFGEEAVVFRTDTRSLLSGIIYCGHCGCRLCFNHHHEERKLAGGGTSVYDYETYRCYRKISSKRTCQGQTVYKAFALNEAVEQQVKMFLSKIESVPRERLMELASARNEETYKVAFKQAQKDFENAEKQVTALEEEAVKALTGESQLDLSVVNSMLVKHRAKLEAAHTAMEEAQTRMQAKKENAKETKAQIDELLSWAECFEKADIGTKHLIVARLVERVDVSTGYKVHIKFRISLKQFLGQE